MSTPSAKKTSTKPVAKKATTATKPEETKPDTKKVTKTETEKKVRSPKQVKPSSETKVTTPKTTPRSKKKEEQSPKVKTSVKKVKSENPEEEKKTKKRNNGPTLAETQGLNISPPKVKNFISNFCINRQQFLALKEVRDKVVEKDEEITFSLKSLSDSTMNVINEGWAAHLASMKDDYRKDKLKSFSAKEREKYMQEKKDEHKSVSKEHDSKRRFTSDSFNLEEFDLKFDANFYKDFKVADYDKFQPEDDRVEDWRSLKNEALFEYVKSLINKTKIRFNDQIKIYIAAFIERVLRQLISNGLRNCISAKKKIVSLDHALDTSTGNFSDFTLYPLITTLPSFMETLKESEKEVVPEPAVEDAAPVEDDSDDMEKKYQFKHYIDELRRTVRSELSKQDCPDDPTQSAYNETSISKKLKQFCSNTIIGFLKMFGNLLLVEVETRDVKTINYVIVEAVFRSLHIIHHLDNEYYHTTKFIQHCCEQYKDYVDVSKSEKKTKKDAKA